MNTPLDLDAPRVMPIDVKACVEVRAYPDLADAATYTEAVYRIGALVSDQHGVYALALERQTDDGRTEVLRLRLVFS